jgi:hypothetical protein
VIETDGDSHGADVEAAGGMDILVILSAMWAMCCCALVVNVVVIFFIFYYLFFFVWFDLIFYNMRQLLLILYIPEHHFGDFRTFRKRSGWSACHFVLVLVQFLYYI